MTLRKMLHSIRVKSFGLLAFALVLMGLAVSCAVTVDEPSVVYAPVAQESKAYMGDLGAGKGGGNILAYGREGQDLNLHLNVDYPSSRSALPSNIGDLYSNDGVKFIAVVKKPGSVDAVEYSAVKIEETVAGAVSYKLFFSFPGFVSQYSYTYKVQIFLSEVSTGVKLMESEVFDVAIPSNVSDYEDTVNTWCLYPSSTAGLGTVMGSIDIKVFCNIAFELEVVGLPAGVVIDNSNGEYSIVGSDIVPGKYEATFTIAKTGSILYQWKENVIVYPGLTTDRWSSNSASAVNSNRKDLSGIGRTEFYVRSTTGSDSGLWDVYSSDQGSDVDGDGSIKKPYATVQKAIDVINDISSIYAGSQEFTIRCDGEFSPYTDNTTVFASVANINLGTHSLRIIGIGSSHSVFDGTGVENTVLYTSSNLYLDNIWIKNGRKNRGAGMYLGGPATLKKCKVTNCINIGAPTSQAGAGIFCGYGVAIKILEDVHICDNKSPDGSGAGIYLLSSTLNICAPLELKNNEAACGAGIYKATYGFLKVNGIEVVSGTEPGLDYIGGINDCEDVYDEGKKYSRINESSGNARTDRDRLQKAINNCTAGVCVCLGRSDSAETIFQSYGALSLPNHDVTLRCTSWTDAAGEKSNRAVLKGGGIKANTASANYILNGITIRGVNGNSLGSGISALTGKWTLNGCRIESCNSTTDNTGKGGGGIYIEGEVTMNGGAITGCSSNEYGGGIYIAGSGKASLNNVEIYDNRAPPECGSGIYHGGNNLSISGSTSIASDNEVFLSEGNIITIDSTLSGTLPVATITPETYDNGGVVRLLANNSFLLGNYRKFAVTDNNTTISGISKWKIKEDGTLIPCENNVADLTSVPVSGTYKVYDQAGLEKIAEFVKSGNALIGCTFEMENDIYAKGDFKPLSGGSSYNSNPFMGTFDGKGNTIFGIDLTNDTSEYSAVFGCLSGSGEVKNLKVEGVGNHAGLVGFMGGGSVYNCENRIAINSTKADNGGIVSVIGGNGKISRCTNFATITSIRGYTGGIVGNAYGSGCLIENCKNLGVVVGSNATGGIAGAFAGVSGGVNGIVRNCSNEADVFGTTGVGGIAGISCQQNSNSGIKNCYNAGDISGSGYVGGIVGKADLKSSYSVYIVNTNNIGTICRTSGTESTFGAILGGVDGTGTLRLEYNYFERNVSPRTGCGFAVDGYAGASEPVSYLDSRPRIESSVTIGGNTYTDAWVQDVLNAWIDQGLDPGVSYIEWGAHGSLFLIL